MARVYALLKEKKEVVKWLKLALDKGFFNEFELLSFSAFSFFAEDPDFQDVLSQIREKREQFAGLPEIP